MFPKHAATADAYNFSLDFFDFNFSTINCWSIEF